MNPYGVIFEVDKALKISEYSLEMLLLQEVKRTYHTSKKSRHWFFKEFFKAEAV